MRCDVLTGTVTVCWRSPKPRSRTIIKRSRFSEKQIIGIMKEQEAGMATAEVCRRHQIGSATFYKWKSKFVGLDVL